MNVDTSYEEGKMHWIHGVIKRLSTLTSATPENENMPLNEIYPEHAEALERAQLKTPLWDSLRFKIV